MASTYTWTLQSGTLPPGLTLATGETDLDSGVSGTPTTPGTYDFTVRITNDVSGDFDDQEYSVTIGEAQVEITPDTGLSIDQMFDAGTNPFLTTVPTSSLTLDGDLSQATKFGSLKQVVLEFDIGLGAGENPYWFNLSSVKPGLPGGRWYYWRLNNATSAIGRVFLV